VRGIVDGRVAATPIEWALVALARASVETPAHLAPSDLAPLRALVGDGALDYALVLAAFHFINRMADLLQVDDELPGLPWLRRVEPVRRGVVRLMSAMLGRMDLGNRRYARTFEEAVGLMPAGTDPAALAPLRARPHVVEAIALAIQERDARSTLDRATLSRVHAVVEAALPACADDARGLDPRPVDPIDAFAFVGTRYPQRTTDTMIDSLRARGLDDVAILDLATAVADANQWARLRRVVGLPASLFAPSAV
jgi:alkylhydroperoxidase family enzyme